MSEVGTASRRRRGPSGSDSEYDERAESNNGAIVTVKSDDECAEGDESSEYTDQTESEGGERDPADGESPTEEHLDDDEDVKNPAFIPRKGAFYEHDSRAELEGEGKEKTAEEAERPRKNLWKEKEKWAHDCFDEREQAPKSREELMKLYGYDIRSKDTPPDDPPTTYSESRGYGRGRGNRRRGRSSFGEYLPNPRSQRGQYRGRRQYNRSPRRGGYGRKYDNRSDERPSQGVRSSDGGPEDTRSSDRESQDVKSQDVRSQDVRSQDVRPQDVRSQEEPVVESRPVEKPKPKMKSQDVRTELAEEQRQVTGQPASDRQPAVQAEQAAANQKSSRTHRPDDRGDGPSKSANVNREESRPKRYSAQRQNVGTAAPQKYPHTHPNAPPLVAGQPFIASAPTAIAGPSHQQIPNPVMAAIPGAMALTQTTPPIAGVTPLMQAGSAYVMPNQPLPVQGMTSIPTHGIAPAAATGQIMAAPAPNLPPTQFQPQVATISPQVAQTTPVVSEPGLTIGGAVYYQSPAEGTTYYPAQVPTTSNDLNTYFSSTSQTSGTAPSGGSQGVVFYDTQGQVAGQSKPRVRNVIAIVKPEANRVEGEGQHATSSQSGLETNEQTDIIADHPPSRTDESQTDLSHVTADKINSSEVKTDPISVSENMPTASDSVEQSSDPVTPADKAAMSADTPASVEQKSASSSQTCDVTQSVEPSTDSQSGANKTPAAEIDSDSEENFADAEEELAGGDKQLPVKVPTSAPSEQGDATPQTHTDTEV